MVGVGAGVPTNTSPTAPLRDFHPGPTARGYFYSQDRLCCVSAPGEAPRAPQEDVRCPAGPCAGPAVPPGGPPTLGTRKNTGELDTPAGDKVHLGCPSPPPPDSLKQSLPIIVSPSCRPPKRPHTPRAPRVPRGRRTRMGCAHCRRPRESVSGAVECWLLFFFVLLPFFDSGAFLLLLFVAFFFLLLLPLFVSGPFPRSSPSSASFSSACWSFSSPSPSLRPARGPSADHLCENR